MKTKIFFWKVEQSLKGGNLVTDLPNLRKLDPKPTVAKDKAIPWTFKESEALDTWEIEIQGGRIQKIVTFCLQSN